MSELFFRTFFNNHVGMMISMTLLLSLILVLINIYLLLFRRRHLKKMEQDHKGQVDMNLRVFESNIERFIEKSLNNMHKATNQLEKIATDGVDSMAIQIKNGKDSITNALQEFNEELEKIENSMEEMRRAINHVSNENQHLHSLIEEKEGRIIKQNYRIESLRKNLKSKCNKESNN